MEREIFLDHYRICRNDDGSREEIARSVEAITYKANGVSTGEPFALQLIPTAIVELSAREQFEEQARAIQALDHVHIARTIAFGIEDDHFVFVSEYLPGETVESWVTAYGPMPPDSVLRIALQLASALTAAANHGLIHRTIQPSNLAIVPDKIAEGGWPFVKLTNFTPAGMTLQPGEFASPEQLQNGTVDFRSEIYSLGATMCFLLSGIAASNEARLRQIKQFPKPLRNLLAEMLRPNPDERPQDSLLFAETLRKTLRKVERRQTFARRLGVPLAGTIPQSARSRSRIPRRALAFAALLLAAAAVAAVLLPEDVVRTVWHRNRNPEQIGVPVGLPETSPEPSPELAANATVAPTPELRSTSTPAVVAQENNTEPSPPAEGPESSPPVAEEALASANTNADAQLSATPAAPAKAQTPAAASKRKSSTTSKRTRAAQVPPSELAPESAIRSGPYPARYLGTTPDGRFIFGLPNGEIKIVRPRPHRFRYYPLERREPAFEPPFQPYD
jgi:serine/threonine-protein kinase